MQIKMLVLVGSVAMTALPVAAQAADPYPPYALPQHGAAPTPVAYFAVLPPYEIEAVVRSMGLRPLAPPLLHRRFYVVHAIDARGFEHRVVVNAKHGHVVHVGPAAGWDAPRYGAPPVYPRYGAIMPRGRGIDLDVDMDVDVDVDVDLDRRPVPPRAVQGYPRPYEPRHEAPRNPALSGTAPQPKPQVQPAPKSASVEPAVTPTPRPRPEAANARAEQTASAPKAPVRVIEIKKQEPAPVPAAKPDSKLDDKPGAVTVPVAPLL